jgi:hypothetical protein
MLAPRADLPPANNTKGLDRQTSLTAGTETKSISGVVANLPAFPVVIAEWNRNLREVIRVALDKYNGRHTIDVRVWYYDGATFKPGRSGMTLALSHLPAFAEAMGKALDAARKLGLMNDGGKQ